MNSLSLTSCTNQSIKTQATSRLCPLKQDTQLRIGQKLVSSSSFLNPEKHLELEGNKHGFDEAAASNYMHLTSAFLPTIPPPVWSAWEPLLLLDPILIEQLPLILSDSLESSLQKWPNICRFWAKSTESWSEPSLITEALPLWIFRSWLSLV